MNKSVLLAPAVSGQQSPARRDLLEASLAKVVAWVKRHNYRGYEPADGNASIFFPLTSGRVMPMRVIQQLVLRSPINIRPLIGVRPHESAIGLGYLAWAYVHMYRRSKAEETRNDAVECFDWLIANRAGAYDEYCWGDPYEYATRSGRRPLGEPILIWTSLIGLAFLDALETLGHERYLDVARSISRWVLGLPREETERGCCLSYVTYRQSSIHNANIMGAAFLARLGALIGDAQCLDVAERAMRYTATRQRSDGSWWYAEEPKYHWVDNFHTGYNLSALRVYCTATQDDSYKQHSARGLSYYKASFVEPDGRPRYFHDRLHPIDIQCAAQLIETLVAHHEADVECLPIALSVAHWTVAHLQAEDGHFMYRDLGWTKVNTPMLHWGQGTMAKALTVLINALDACQRSSTAS